MASGVSSLQTQLGQVPSGDDVVIFGYSQGAAVTGIEKADLAAANGGLVPKNISFVLIGNPERPNGGVFERLAALGTVPILDATFGIPTPTDTARPGQTNTTDIALQYDGVADFPEYPINVLADLNAIAGFGYVHGDYLLPDGAAPTGTLPYEYTPATLEAAIDNPANQQVYGDTTYITIPATSLPLLQRLRPADAVRADPADQPGHADDTVHRRGRSGHRRRRQQHRQPDTCSAAAGLGVVADADARDQQRHGRGFSAEPIGWSEGGTVTSTECQRAHHAKHRRPPQI